MLVVFRADASFEIGTGHVMRCRSLALLLANQGHRIIFIMRHCLPELHSRLKQDGFAVEILPPLVLAEHDDSPYAHWLGVPELADASAVLGFLSSQLVDMVVVDHYALGRRWEQAVSPACQMMCAVDDLAERQHSCDLLIDPNNSKRDTSGAAVVLGGPEYAFVRPMFAQWRAYAQVRSKVHSILLFFGGVDSLQLTLASLKILSGLPPEMGSFKIVAVVGASSPGLEELRLLSELGRCEIHVQTEEMPRLMKEADLMITTASSVNWERSTLGLPAVLVPVSENQQIVAAVSEGTGSALVLQLAEFSQKLAVVVSGLLNNRTALAAMSEASFSTCDGHGVFRVAEYLLRNDDADICLRRACYADSRLLYRWQKEPGARRFFRNPMLPTWPEHCRWLCEVLRHRQTDLYLLTVRGEDVGYLRIDRIRHEAAEVSILIAGDYRGRGLGLKALRKYLKLYPKARLRAWIKWGNRASRKTFLKAGFKPRGVDWYEYCG